jgi:hypothetical protein
MTSAPASKVRNLRRCDLTVALYAAKRVQTIA